MKIIILVVNLCVFELCFGAPNTIQSVHDDFEELRVKQGVGLKNEKKLWLKINDQVIVPWEASKEISKKTKIVKFSKY